MENTTLASTQHTSGRLKNGSPLMWWLHALSLKFSFRKKNMLFRCVLNLFDPFFLQFSFFLLTWWAFVFRFFSFSMYSHKILSNVRWTLPQLTFFHFATFWLFLLKPWKGARVVTLVAAAGFIEESDVFFCESICSHVYMLWMCAYICAYLPSLGKCSYGTRLSINPANFHE